MHHNYSGVEIKNGEYSQVITKTLYEENSNRKPVFIKSVSIKRLSESANIATVKRLLLKSETNTETETNLRIFAYLFFFGIKNVRVGRSETHIFFALT
jgi:hypothetical protein